MARNGGVGDEESQFNSKVQSIDSIPRSVDWKNVDKKPIISNFRSRLGLEDFYSYKVWQASIAELLGTAILVFGIDTIVIASFETETKQPNLLLSILVAVLIAILLLATIPVSGGHINPVVTFSAALLGLITISRAIIYILAQCLGGVLGALALKAVIGNSIEHTFSLGGCTVTVIAPGPDGPTTVGIDRSAALWLEIICTFVVLFASVWMAFDERQGKALGHVTVCAIVGIVMGLMVFVSTTVTTKRGYSGVGMHPARCFGPAVVRGGHLWDEHWIFWVGPTISCVAFYMYIKIIPKEHFKH